MNVQRFEAGAARLYRIPLDLFPGLTGWAHLVVAPGAQVLIDVGSGIGDSNAQLEAGLEAVRRAFREPVGWDRLTHVVITHGHIDHFGGLPFVRQRTRARLGIHRLDRPVLVDFERRLEATAARLRRFLEQAGVAADELSDLMDLYLFAKNLYTRQRVDFVLGGGETRLGPLDVLHVSGHCPGQIVLRLNGLLLTSDHVLPDVTPHMAPEALATHTGLRRYLRSLDRFEAWRGAARLALGGHGEPIDDVGARVAAIRRHHADRLRAVLAALDDADTVAGIAHRLFPAAAGYHRLLALEEVGAHVEALEAEGRIVRVKSGDRLVRLRRRAGADDHVARPVPARRTG